MTWFEGVRDALALAATVYIPADLRQRRKQARARARHRAPAR